MMMLQLRDRLMALGIRMMTLVGIMSSPSLDKGRSEALIRGVVRMISS